MILQLFFFGLFFLAFGIFNFVKKKKLLGWFFLLLALFATIIGMIVVRLYPQTIPFQF